jgi:hypothetical protein
MNLKAYVIPASNPAPVCSASTPGSSVYSDSGLLMVWTVNQGASQTRYVCIYNAGTVNDLLAFSYNPSPLPNGLVVNNQFGICTSGTCISGNSLPAGGYALSTVVLTASQSSQVGQTTGAFTIYIS